MKMYSINIGLVIHLWGDKYLYRSHNNKWYVEEFRGIVDGKKEEVSFDMLKPKGKQGAIKRLFEQ